MTSKMSKLLPKDILPARFDYPPQLLRIVDQNLIDLQPWVILLGDPLRERYLGLSSRFPKRTLVPFARRWDNDDLACWDGRDSVTVFVIHDFASPGYEQRQKFESFWDWFRSAIEDMIEHNS